MCSATPTLTVLAAGPSPLHTEELNLEFLQDQYMLLTAEPFLWPLFVIFFFTFTDSRVYVNVRGQPTGADFLLLPWESWGLNSSHQGWQQGTYLLSQLTGLHLGL